MRKATRYVGLDVHVDSIAVAVAEEGRDGEVRSLGMVENHPAAIRKLVKRLGGPKGIRVCYEAGPTGYVLYWQLVELGVDCEVIAPSLIPSKPGDRVKTDRRDAVKLARCYRAGDLTAVWVPDPAHEALRDLVRAREAAKKDQLRAQHRLLKFLLRSGRRPSETMEAFGTHHREWLRAQKFEYLAQQAAFVDYLAEVEHAAERVRRLESALDDAVKTADATTRALIEGLQAFRGIAKLTATTIVAEVGRFARFDRATRLMSWAGITPSEHSTGGPKHRRQGAITKCGNAHLRRVLVEAAWAYRHRPSNGRDLQRRQRELPAPIKERAWKAQHRLHRRYVMMSLRGKPAGKVATAIARELLGFVWAVARDIEQQHETNKVAAAA